MGTQAHISLDTVIYRNTDKFLASSVGDEMVMMDMESAYIGINAVGRTIWEKIENPLAVKDIIGFLLTEYNVSREQCEQETFPYLIQMLEQGLIRTA